VPRSVDSTLADLDSTLPWGLLLPSLMFTPARAESTPASPGVDRTRRALGSPTRRPPGSSPTSPTSACSGAAAMGGGPMRRSIACGRGPRAGRRASCHLGTRALTPLGNCSFHEEKRVGPGTTSAACCCTQARSDVARRRGSEAKAPAGEVPMGCSRRTRRGGPRWCRGLDPRSWRGLRHRGQRPPPPRMPRQRTRRAPPYTPRATSRRVGRS